MILACAVLLVAPTGAVPALGGTVAEPPGDVSAAKRMPGYTAENAVRQRAYEARFRESVNPDVIGANSRALSARPHHLGSPGTRRSAEDSLRALRSYGLDAHLETYRVHASVPKHIGVTMTGPQHRDLAVRERGFPWLPDQKSIVDGYNAYSPAGNVSGEVVYANYGRPEDFAAIDRLGVDVRDKIVLVRYGKNFRGVKTDQAEQRGARGVVIYSDPADDGFTKGPVYPEGPWRPDDAIQRGSIQRLWQYPGDPLTPGKPAVDGVPRLDASEARNLPRIPTTPISYGEAEPLLRALGGPAAPREFQGGLDFPHHVGPGATRLNLDLDIDYRPIEIRNVVATVPGRTKPDEAVVLGGHYDAWTYGANDNNSGWVTSMEIGRVLADLRRDGWQPDRSIVISGWDGEEYGLLGSTEWTEQHRSELARKAVAYINMDGVAGRRFEGGGVPATDELLAGITKKVRAPGENRSVYDAWRDGDPTPKFERPGSGSDYTPFLDHLGVPVMSVGFSSPGGEYHSAYDDTTQTERFLDPGYLGHAAAAKVTGLSALRLANADAAPLRYAGYAGQVRGYVDELGDVQRCTPGSAKIDLSALVDATDQWRQATQRLQERTRELLDRSDPAARGELDRINAIVRRQERLLTTEAGLPGRPWYRHQIYAPGVTTGYAVQYLPGLRDAVEQGDRATAERYRQHLLDSLHAATRDAREVA